MTFNLFTRSANNSFEASSWTPPECPAWIYGPTLEAYAYCSYSYFDIKGAYNVNGNFVFDNYTTPTVNKHKLTEISLWTSGNGEGNITTSKVNEISFLIRIKNGWGPRASTPVNLINNSASYQPGAKTTFSNIKCSYVESNADGSSTYKISFSGAKVASTGNSSPAGIVDVELYIEEVPIVVTYNANGGSVSPTSASVSAGSSTTLPTPTRTGYTCSGWYTAASGGTKVGDAGASYSPTANTTLYAQWTPITYTIAFNGNGSTGGSTASITAKYNTSYNLTANGFTKSGGHTVTFNGNGGGVSAATLTSSYSFSKWNTKADGTGTSYNNQASVKNLRSSAGTFTLYAQWQSNAITLTSATRVGYTFNGWYTAASGGTKVGNAGAAYTPTGNVTLYAQWTAKTYTITFNSNGGSTPSPSSKTVTYNSTYGTLPTVTRTGYTFAGWYTATSGGTKIESTSKVTITSAQTLYASWTANTYTVSFNANGGSVSQSSKTVTYNSAYGELPTPTRAQYNFVGWFTATSGGSQVTATTTVSTASNHTLYARWAVGNYTVKFDGNGATSGAMSNQTFTFGVAQNLSANTYVKHDSTYGFDYDFLGWSKSNSATAATYVDKQSVSNIASSVNETVTLYAVWRKKTLITVRSNDPNLGTVNDVTGYYSVGSKITLAATIKDSTKIRFLGWYVGDVRESTSASYTITVGADDKIYEARFRSIVHYLYVTDPTTGGDVSVIVAGTEVSVNKDDTTQIEVLEGESVKLVAIPAYNYDWKNWVITDGGVAKEYDNQETSIVISESNSTEIYAIANFVEKPKFSIKIIKTGRASGTGSVKIVDTYGHTFNEGSNGELNAQLYVGLQYTAQASLNTTDSNILFNGWYRDDSLVQKDKIYVIQQSEAKDITLKADFKSLVHILNISSTEPNYCHLEAKIGTNPINLTGVVVTDGQRVSVKAIVSNLRTFNCWTVEDEEVSIKNETVIDINESMGDEIDVVAVIESKSSFRLSAEKENGEYGTISLSYDDVIDTETGELKDNTVTFIEDANGVISTTAYTGIEYTAVAVVKENLSLAGRQLWGFDGWYAKINSEFKKQTSELNWRFADIENIKARFVAFELYSIDCSVIAGEGTLSIDTSYNAPDEGDNKFLKGQFAKIVARPDEGYEVNFVSVKKLSSGEVFNVKESDYLLTNIDSDYEIKVNFSKKKCPVTFVVDSYSINAGEITASVDGVNEPDFEVLEYGDRITFSASAFEDYQFSGWYIDGSLVSENESYTITLNSAINIVAKFKAMVVLRKNTSFSAAGNVFISNTPEGGWQQDNSEYAKSWITLGDNCYIKAEATSGAFGAWYNFADIEFDEPLDLSDNDSFQVLGSTILVARFISEEDYVYIALSNDWVDETERDDSVLLGILSMTNGDEITEEEYNQGIRNNGYIGPNLYGAYIYYRFLGSKKSELKAVSNAGRTFDRWERKTLIDGAFGDSLVLSREDAIYVNTNRNYIFTAFWGTPKPVDVTIRFTNDSFNLGTLRLDGEVESRVEMDSYISVKILQGKIVSIAADAKNGYKFVGWFLDSDGMRMQSSEQNYSFEVRYGITLYAKFEEDRNAIYKWEGSSVLKTLRWKSKMYVSTKPFDLGCARIDGTGYPVKMKIDLFSSPDVKPINNNVKDIEILSQDSRRLPRSRPERYCQIEVQANKEVNAVFLGTNMKEIAI